MLQNALRSPQTWSRPLPACLCHPQCPPSASRSISTNSAIHQGLRNSLALERSGRANRPRPLFGKELRRYDRTGAGKANIGPQAIQSGEKRLDLAAEDSSVSRRSPPKIDLDGRIAIPYTTAASKFLYGSSAVKAALKAKRRRLYKLYLHERATRRPNRVNLRAAARNKEEPGDETLEYLASGIDSLKVINVGDDWLPVMDEITEGRPHNGVILEASPLPVIPTESLRVVTRARPYFNVVVSKQSAEDRMINGTNDSLPYNSHGWRYPLVLFLDGIVDTGNLGAIIRSAHYLGVDAVAISKRSTASLDSIAIKASSGAAEAMPVISVNDPLSFLSRSAINGWRIYAADAPPPLESNFSVTSGYKRRALDPQNTSPLISFTRPNSGAVLRDHSPLVIHPSILMFGGEATGHRMSLRNKANYTVGIRGVTGFDVGVDSLNVSVAAAMIMLEFLKKPQVAAAERLAAAQKPDGDELLF